MKTKALLLALMGILCGTLCHAQSPPPIPEPMELLTGYLFQDTNFLSVWGDQPLSQTNLALVQTWDNYGLQVDATNAAWLSYAMESDGYPNLFLTNGTLEIWVQPNWISQGLDGTGSGVWSRIIDVGQWTSNASYGWFSLFTDPSGVNLFFSAQNSDGVQTNYLTTPIAWDGTTWHYIVLTYSAANTCIYIDGVLATNGPGISILPPPEALSNGFYVLSDPSGLQQFHGQADRLWIYGNQETDTNQIASDYAYYNAFANPPPHLGGFGDDDPPAPGGGGGGGTNSGGPTADGIYSPPYGSNDFWLRILPLGTNAYNTDSNSLSIILYGTTNGYAYQIWTTTNIVPPVTWTQQQIFPGATNTNFTVFLFPFTNGPSMFFTAVNYSQDTDGDGLPDWWEMKYSTADFPLSPTNADTGDTGIPDGYKQDSAGDGYNNLQKFQMGIPPNVFISPPAPNNFSAVLNTNGQIIFSWSPAPNLPTSGAGAVTGYTLTIEDPLGYYIATNITFGATQTNYVFTPDPATEAYLSSGNDFPDVSLQTDYANTNSATAASAPFNYNYQVEACIVRGPQGRLNLIAPNIPPGVQAIRVYVNEIAYGTSYPKESSFMQPSQYLTNNPAYGGGYTYAFDAPVSGFTNGIYIIPYSQIPIYLSSFQYTVGAVANDGSVGPPPSDKVWAEFVGYISNIPFLDGRTNLQQNLAFLLQAANSGYPFSYYAINSSGYWSFNTPPGSNYVSAGFSVDTAYQYFPFDPGYNVNLDEFQPFEDNYFYRNFVVTATDINSDGSLKTGVYNTDGIDYLGYVATNLPSFMFDTYTFCADGLTNAPPAILTNWQWTFFDNTPYVELGDIGVAFSNSTQQFFLLNNQSNYYGLPFISAEVADFTNGTLSIENLTTGNPVTTHSNHSYYLFPQTAAPELTTIGYYFARTVPNGYYSVDPQPGDGVFATTNTTPLMIAGVGGTFGISGWAKQAISNGDPAMFAYLEQYFDQALLCDTNGNVTTNSAGILSEYGEFFPIYPGEVALVTKPDITTGQRGTNFIYVIGLQLDANHDGTMNPSFTGPDSTSPARPFQFWLNNNFDRNVLDPFDNAYYDDDIASNDPAATCPGAPNAFTPDFNFLNGAGNRTIPCVRDLQDFARLWVSGITSNLLTNLPSGSTVTLNWGDVGYPNPGNPTIDLFVAADTNGGIGYLTNDTIAFKQCLGLTAPYMGRLGPGQSIQLNASQFTNQWAGNYFIWCGVTNGSGTLYVTIQDANSNILAQSGAVIQIQDIKQMYERWTIGDAPSLGPSNTAYLAKDDFTPGQSVIPFQYSLPTDTNTPYILYVHGWNMPVWVKDRFAETAFKRLYWQGYQGRFGVFRWPTYYDFDGSLASIVFDRRNYDNSEFNAWQSAAALGGLLTNLSSEYSQNVYVLGHSMGNVVAGEALREAGNSQLVNTYVASQAAIPAHVYDGSITNSIFTSGSPQTPNIYTNWLADNYGGGAEQVISFYNTNDYALAPGRWEFNQVLKPDQGLFAWNYFFEGTPYSGAANYTPGSVDDSPPWNYFIKEDARETPIYFNVVGVLSNRFEVMAYAAQARSPALGRIAGVGNLTQSFDLTTIWPPDTNPNFQNNLYGEHFYHSAEFRGDCWDEWNYWNTLLYSGTKGFNIGNQ